MNSASYPRHTVWEGSGSMSTPLVVWDQHVSCPGCDGEIRVTSDGTHVYAVTDRAHDALGGDRYDPVRYLSYVTLSCGAPDGAGGWCAANVTVDLATEHWTTDRELRDLLGRIGVLITREGVDV